MAVDDKLMSRAAALRSPSMIRDMNRSAAFVQAEPAAVAEPMTQSESPGKKADPRPKPGEAYRPCARFMNRLEERQTTLHFIAGDCTPTGFPYANFDGIRFERSGEPGGGLDLVVRFAGVKPTDVRLAGRHLGDIYDMIAAGTLPWVWERPEGIYREDDTATVVTGIIFTELER
jgi:hypothetical protein